MNFLQISLSVVPVFTYITQYKSRRSSGTTGVLRHLRNSIQISHMEQKSMSSGNSSLLSREVLIFYIVDRSPVRVKR